MMWGIRVQQILQQYNQLLNGTLGFADMEMSYWHHLSSLNMRWRWRGLDRSGQFHCSCTSLMAPLRDSYLSGLLQTFITEIALLIRSPSVSPSFFASRAMFKARSSQRYLSIHLCHTFILRKPRLGMRFSPWPFRRLRTPAPWLWWWWQSRGNASGSPRLHFLCHLATSAIRAPRMCRCRFVPARWCRCGAKPLWKHNPCTFTNR